MSTDREIGLYMASGIEASAKQCIRDGYVEKGERMLAWAAEVRAQAEAEEEDEPLSPDQGELFK